MLIKIIYYNMLEIMVIDIPLHLMPLGLLIIVNGIFVIIFCESRDL